MRSERFQFDGAQGAPLSARLDMPAGKQPRAFAVLAHCFTCGKDSVAAARIARALTGHGIAVLRFDFTGLGGSGGDFGNADFSSNVDDLVLAADHLRRHAAAPSLLIGHSLGGAAVIAATDRIPEARAIVTIGAPADPAQVLQLLAGSREEIETRGEADVVLAGRTFRLRRSFVQDIAAQPQARRIRTLQRPLLVMHSPTDELVDVDHARRIFDMARHPKSFISLSGADHLLTRREDAAFAADVLAAWASRYLPPSPLQHRTATTPAGEGTVVVSSDGPAPYGQLIAAGRHLLTADEPQPIGADSGASPYGLLLSALGSCTAMTVRMYAERKQWQLDRVTVRLRHTRIHADDCAQCEAATGMLDRIERVITFEGALEAEQRRRLLEIADKCPVHRTLRSQVLIETSEQT